MWVQEREVVGKGERKEGVRREGREAGPGWSQGQSQSRRWIGQQQETLKREPPGKCRQP